MDQGVNIEGEMQGENVCMSERVREGMRENEREGEREREREGERERERE